jgi:ceramide glucosyltransferase
VLVTGWIGYAFAALAVIGIGYQLVALAALRRFFAREAPRRAGDEPVTLLKPLYGTEPRLTANLASFLAQDYAGAVQMVCGVGEPDDPAIAAVAELRRGHLLTGIALTTGPRGRGANAKIGNLMAMMPAAAHDILVLSDSDMAVTPDYLAKLLAALDQPGVGAVTCLYAGRGDAGLWSRVGAAAISYTGLPNMVMALATSIAQPCMGSTIAIRRETLEAIGGFARFADQLADDYAIGEALAARGLKVAVPPMLLTHACADRSLAELWRHHLRWSVTIRGVAPKRHAGSGVTHALAFALLTVPFLPVPGLGLTAAALAVRLTLARTVDRLAGTTRAPFWLVPLADILEFTAFLASLTARTIDWRGSRLTMAPRGRIADFSTSATETS